MTSDPILLVDDNAPFRHLLAAFLHKAGYKTVEAENGQQALALIAEKKPALILLDLLMLPVGGFDFMPLYKETGHRAPVVLITGDGASDVLMRASALGFAGVLKKPVNEERIVQTVRRFLTHLDG